MPNLGGRGLSHQGDLMFPKKTLHDVMHEWVHCDDEAANHQLPISMAVFIMLHLSASEEH